MQVKKSLQRLLLIVPLITLIYLVANYYNPLDGIKGFLASIIFRKEDTVYASGYSDKAFKRAQIGMSKKDVLEILKTPIMESWKYTGDLSCLMWFKDDVVCGFYYSFDNRAVEKIEEGMKKDNVVKLYGHPHEESWIYSESPSGKSYRMRKVVFMGDKVVEKIQKFFSD